MRNLLLIGGFGISLFFVLASIPDLRIYSRTGMKGFLLMGISEILVAIGVFGVTIRVLSLDSLCGWYFWEYLFCLPFLMVFIVGLFMGQVGFIFNSTRESGLWNEICEKTPITKRIIGSVPILKYDKVPSPFLSKRTGLILGISLMTAGILIIITIILFKFSFLRGLLIASSITSFISGLLFVIFSIVYLNKGQKSSK